MKIKGKAVGDNKIPTTDRIFFTVHPPLSNPTQTSRPLFVSKTWTVSIAVSSVIPVQSSTYILYNVGPDPIRVGRNPGYPVNKGK